jgi:hypothetical protein
MDITRTATRGKSSGTLEVEPLSSKKDARANLRHGRLSLD